MINEQDNKVYVEIATALNAEGFEQAQEALKQLQGGAETVSGTLKRLLDLSGEKGSGGLAATVEEQLQSASVQSMAGAVSQAQPARQTAADRDYERLLREELDRTDYLLSEKGRMYELFFGARDTELADWDRDATHTENQRWIHNREIVRRMDQEWEDLSKTVAGGFREAMAVTEAQGTNWTRNWLGMIDSATGDAAQAFKNFFDRTKGQFLDLETLCRDIFNAIADAFADMVARMAAKAAILSVFKATGLFGGSILDTVLGSFDTGGAVQATGLYRLHQGEYVLPPEVVRSIKEDRAPSAAGAAYGQGAQISLTVNAPVTVNGAASGAAGREAAREIAAQIAEAARRGTAWAVEHSKITYKVGQSRTAEAAL
ncbi:MAG: hypothetical protein GX410_02430 [Elusimicrobia bacterium]|nr:hypothetical protein [Elusimicrobiota bacterium]